MHNTHTIENKPELDRHNQFSNEEILQIKQEIADGLTYAEIQKRHNIRSAGFVSGINSGRYFHEKGRTYPIFDKVKYGNRVKNLKWVTGIKKDLKTTSMSFTAIAKRWRKSIKTVSKINRGLCYKKTSESYPLRKV